MDFNDTQITLTLSTSIPYTCFSVVLIDDNIFEARREEFFVNITTSDNSVTLMPNFIAVNINDDDCKLSQCFDCVKWDPVSQCSSYDLSAYLHYQLFLFLHSTLCQFKST